MSINCQKVPSLRFLIVKIISIGHIVSKCNYLCSLDLGEHVRYPQHLMNYGRTLSRAIQSEIKKISKSNFLSEFIVFLLSECYKIFNITAKKVLLKITLNSIQIALEKFLYHFVRYCGYLTCCLGCKEYLACNFESMTPTKNLGNKRRRGSSFSQLRLILDEIL